VAVSMTGPFLFSRACLPGMIKEGRGRIVNFSSTAGKSVSTLAGAHYTASKAGLLGLTRHLARELGPRGIRVNAVCPGPIQTALLDSEIDEEGKRRLVANVPLGRLGVPEDIARVIVFLASGDAAFITGAALDANGGIFMA
jgi:3-oxoacyl-[acyl-carrier protein] reductase